ALQAVNNAVPKMGRGTRLRRRSRARRAFAPRAARSPLRNASSPRPSPSRSRPCGWRPSGVIPGALLAAVLRRQCAQNVGMVRQAVAEVGPGKDDVALHARRTPVPKLFVELLHGRPAIVRVRE